jgi:hypothetical protein
MDVEACGAVNRSDVVTTQQSVNHVGQDHQSRILEILGILEEGKVTSCKKPEASPDTAPSGRGVGVVSCRPLVVLGLCEIRLDGDNQALSRLSAV